MPHGMAWNYIHAHCRSHGFPREILSGACTGVDEAGELWAARWKVPVRRFPADWSKGRKAGPMRNAEMVANADALLVIRWPDSRGSQDVARQARSRGLRVVEIIVDMRDRRSGDAQ